VDLFSEDGSLWSETCRYIQYDIVVSISRKQYSAICCCSADREPTCGSNIKYTDCNNFLYSLQNPKYVGYNIKMQFIRPNGCKIGLSKSKKRTQIEGMGDQNR
jgi:hypothetical protein